eukprot:TRINITY_DN3952_c0_g1_i1.p1 TRINITY_DN3952_c0_g1~~TRINITY_DN3952_c0_g1_i1.p1  ORF type:complete len:954 (+),score=166.17 TRINITY_DN3952_c0_g1_i1:63-2924(+)
MMLLTAAASPGQPGPTWRTSLTCPTFSRLSPTSCSGPSSAAQKASQRSPCTAMIAACAACSLVKSRHTRRRSGRMQELPQLEAQLAKFQEELMNAWEGFHVHIGGGKIGLGLILPAIVRRGRNFVLLQRPTEKWKNVKDQDSVTVSVNGNVITKLRVVSTLEQLDQASAHALGESQSSRSFAGEVIDLDSGFYSEGILVVSEDPEMISALVARAASFSIAVGTKHMQAAVKPLVRALKKKTRQTFMPFTTPEAVASLDTADSQGNLVEAIQLAASAASGAAKAAGAAVTTAAAVARAAGLKPPRPEMLPPPPLYCCENDHGAVLELEESVAGILSVVPVLVDRVCTSVEFKPDDGIVEVATESYGGDIVFPPVSQASISLPLPFAGANVHEPTTELGARFLHEKKILTVNGTHTTLAFLTLLQAEPETQGPPMSSHELLTYDVDKAIDAGDVDGVGRDLWVWAIARQVQLLSEYHEEIARHTMKKSSTFGKTKWSHISAESGERQALIKGLLNNARVALKRLSHGGDETGRVLGGGVNNRFHTRLANVREFLRATDLKEMPEVAQELLETAGVSEAELRSRVEQVVRSSKRFITDDSAANAKGNTRWGLTSISTSSAKPALFDTKAASMAVLFDFDGTLGDTETPAMEVAFWTIAPYLPSLVSASLPDVLRACGIYVRANAGKAFEHMIEQCDEERRAAGLAPIEELRSGQDEDEGLLELVDRQRKVLGLTQISRMRTRDTEPETLLQQQKEDTVTYLSTAARACPGVLEALGALECMGVPFVISTTSGKPRVPVCVESANLRQFFPSDEDYIHSGESDFDPPRFKPEPDVYLKAAQSVSMKPEDCVAVEDSASGVGSAANAGIGFIVGYVGGSHIPAELKEQHAQMLMAGERSKSGRGADIVISHMFDLPLVVQLFQQRRESGLPIRPGPSDCSGAAGQVFVHETVKEPIPS